MTELSFSESVERFKGNEERINDFVNDQNDAGKYLTSEDEEVESLPALVARISESLVYRVLRSLPGETNAMPRILNALAISDVVHLEGQFSITEVCATVISHKKLRGTRGITKIFPSAEMNGVVFNIGEEGEASNLGMQGPTAINNLDAEKYCSNTDEMFAFKGLGSLTAFKTQRQSSTVEECDITGFSGWAIDASQNNAISLGAKGVDSNIRNNRIAFNFGGLQLPEESEYQKLPGNSICWNVYGVHIKGGNNTVDGSNVDHNRVNFLLSGGANNSHGSFTGGTLNHGKFATLAAENITNGFVIADVNMFDGGPKGIYVRNCVGLNIQASLLGRINVFCEGKGTVAGNPGINLIQGNLFNLHGATYKIYRNWNPITEQSDPNTPDNFIFRLNEHMEGKSSRDGGAWDSAILNDRDALDDDGFIWRELESGNINSRVVAGRPIDGQKYLGNGNQTGAVKITLPVPGFNNSNVRMRVTVRTSNRLSCLIDFGAFVGTSATWSSPVVFELSGTDYPVRLGADADGKPLVYIGDIGTLWSSALVEVEFFSMHGGAWSLSRYWKRGWKIGLEAAALEGVTAEFGSPTQFVGDLNLIDYDSEIYCGSSATNKPGAVTGWCKTRTRGSVPGSGIRYQEYIDLTGALFIRVTSTGSSGYGSWSPK